MSRFVCVTIEQSLFIRPGFFHNFSTVFFGNRFALLKARFFQLFYTPFTQFFTLVFSLTKQVRLVTYALSPQGLLILKLLFKKLILVKAGL